MSEVLGIRIPRELKKAMEELKDVDWRKEIVEFLWKRVEMYKRLKVLKEVRKVLETVPEAPRGVATSLVRGDRDSH